MWQCDAYFHQDSAVKKSGTNNSFGKKKCVLTSRGTEILAVDNWFLIDNVS